MAYATSFDMSDIENRVMGGFSMSNYENNLERLGAVILGKFAITSHSNKKKFLEKIGAEGFAHSLKKYLEIWW